MLDEDHAIDGGLAAVDHRAQRFEQLLGLLAGVLLARQLHVQDGLIVDTVLEQHLTAELLEDLRTDCLVVHRRFAVQPGLDDLLAVGAGVNSH